MSQSNKDGQRVVANINIEGATFEDISIKEILLNESLLNPGLQTAVTLQSHIYSKTVKNFDLFKNKVMSINLKTKDGTKEASIGQTVYRLDNRQFHPTNLGQVEQFTLHGCDQSLLQDAKKLTSKLWKCKTPSSIVREVLTECVGVSGNRLLVDDSQPSRDYNAERIHPFQVVAQQANAAVNDDSPDFVHYMTYDIQGGPGYHHFRSLKNLCNNAPEWYFYHYETGVAGGGDYNENVGKENHVPAISFMFPCDFDLLSDILNGVNEQGMHMNTGGFMNIATGYFQFLGDLGGMASSSMGACSEGFNFKMSTTNKGTSSQHNGCDTDVENHLLKRQARMGLLDRNKVALRLLVPWIPNISVGTVIELRWGNKNASGAAVYGSGQYLVSSLTHNIQLGGFSTTTLDCIAQTAGQGGIV